MAITPYYDSLLGAVREAGLDKTLADATYITPLGVDAKLAGYGLARVIKQYRKDIINAITYGGTHTTNSALTSATTWDLRKVTRAGTAPNFTYLVQQATDSWDNHLTASYT